MSKPRTNVQTVYKPRRTDNIAAPDFRPPEDLGGSTCRAAGPGKLSHLRCVRPMGHGGQHSDHVGRQWGNVRGW